MATQMRKTLSPDWDKVVISKPLSVFERCSIVDRKLSLDDHPGKIEYDRPLQYFATGSTYEGPWNSLGFSGFGNYTFPHGALYKGYFKDGQFDGHGTITYPKGDKLKGFWRNGKLIFKTFIFADGLAVDDPFEYCRMPDRRFQIEVNKGLSGPGEEFLTNTQPTIDIPEGCYDTVDGFCDPAVNCIYSYDKESLEGVAEPRHRKQTDNLLRTVKNDECNYIRRNFRVWSLKTTGYRPDLYEFWMAGSAKEVETVLNDVTGKDLLESANISSTFLNTLD